ncbi:MAG: 6-phosphofructokinase [Chloroflexi bacterium]|nr:6-phosphofructokinase [Chloroflexota bacterium]
MEQIAVLTSGGDAPGMNAAIRAVVRMGLHLGCEVYGVRDGYDGLINGKMTALSLRAVGGIIQQGGTVLGSARSAEFREAAGRQKALDELSKRGIEGLIVIGGNGSQAGGNALYEMGFPVMGVASTIDNDLIGSDITIGVDTALNIALEAIDRLKVTAASHRRAFLVEVMGRDCGYLAMMAGIAGGAEAITIPEVETQPEALLATLEAAYARGKTNGLIVVAEGAKHDAEELLRYFRAHQERVGYELRATILGHVQRGGAPGAFDRLLATRLAATATERLYNGEQGALVGQLNGTITSTPYTDVVGRTKSVDLDLFTLADVLAQ